MRDKVAEMNPEQNLVFLHCILHQDVLCKSVVCKSIDHVSDVVHEIVNFIGTRAPNHRQFVALLEDCDTEHGDIFTTQLSEGSAWSKYLGSLGPES